MLHVISELQYLLKKERSNMIFCPYHPALVGQCDIGLGGASPNRSMYGETLLCRLNPAYGCDVLLIIWTYWDQIELVTIHKVKCVCNCVCVI